MQPRRHEGAKKNKLSSFSFFVFSCRLFRVFVCFFVVGVALPARASAAGKPVTYKGWSLRRGVERAANASLKAVPRWKHRQLPARPGEEFAVVRVDFKVLPAFQPNTC